MTQLEYHIHIHLPPDETQILQAIKESEVKMAVDLQALKDAVSRDDAATQGAITLLNQLAAELSTMAQGSVDPAQLQTMADDLNSHAKALEEATATDTPAPPAPPAPPANPVRGPTSTTR